MTSAAILSATIISIIFTIIGFVGNLATVVALLRDRKIRQHSTTAFILSLSISDLTFSSINLPMLAAELIKEDLLDDEFYCKLSGASFYINAGITTFSIAGIAINRYILVAHYHLYQRFYQMSTILFQLGITWILPILLTALPLLNIWGTIKKNQIICRIMERDGSFAVDFTFGVGIFMPCLVITAVYARIYCQAKLLAKRSSSGSSSARTKERERHLTLMTFLIFISFLICCLPAVIEYLWFLESGDSIEVELIATIFFSLIFIVNPFIYVATNRKYRAAYLQLFLDLKFWKSSDTNNVVDVGCRLLSQ